MRLPTGRHRWLTDLLGQLPLGVVIADNPSGNAVFCNELATRTWPSLLRPPSTNQPVVECKLVRLDDTPYAAADWPLAQAVTSGVTVTETVQFVSSGGVRTVMDVRCSPLLDDNGHASAVAMVMQDVTQRRETEHALRASQARYENLYQDAPDMFASVTIDTEHIVQCNRTLVQVTGYRRDELIGRPIRDLHCQSCWSELDKTLKTVEQAGHAHDRELQLRRKNGGALDVSLSMAAIRDEEGNVYYRSTWRDITQRKQAQAVLKEKQEELERGWLELQALAGRLLTAQEDERRRISRELHDDLNQRIAMLTLETEALHQRLPRSRGTTVERLGTLRDGIIDLSDAVHTLAYKLHASALDDLGLVAALESYLADFCRQESIEVKLNGSDLSGSVPADVASCLYRVAQEALRNVARHARARRVSVSLEQSDGGISMAVADDGVGFRGSLTENVGARLGIVGMQERVRLVDGRFSLVSRPGEGTHIDVWVPAGRIEP